MIRLKAVGDEKAFSRPLTSKLHKKVGEIIRSSGCELLQTRRQKFAQKVKTK